MGTETLGKVAKDIRLKISKRGFSYTPPTPPHVISPYFPPEALAMSRAWELTPRQYAFVQAITVDPGTIVHCPNCGGTGIVEIRLSKAGPFRDPPGNLHQVIFWFDGDGERGKGWYVQHERRAYACPECKTKGRER